jgi:hypothetical protein
MGIGLDLTVSERLAEAAGGDWTADITDASGDPF